MSRIIELKSISAGTMYGPTSAVDGQLFRADGTSGTKVQLAPLVLITDSGQVSIGQLAAPCSRLELWDDSAHPILSITAAHATDYDPQIQFRTNVTDTVKCSMGVDSGDSDKFKIYMGSGIGDTSQFVFTSSERFGINQNTPTEKLHIKNGNILIERDDGSNAGFLLDQNSGTPALWYFTAGTTGAFAIQNGDNGYATPFTIAALAPSNSLRINNSGVIGMGLGTMTAGVLEIYKNMAAPDDLGDFDNYQVVIRGDSTTGDTAGILLSTSLDTYGGSAIVHYDTGGGGQGDLVFYVKQGTGAVPPVECMRLSHTNGNIGIGETSPETIVEMTLASPFFTFHCDTESDAVDSGMCKLIFKREQANGTENPHAAIYAAHDGSSADQKGYIAFLTNDGSDGNVPTEAMRITSNGYLGLGTTTADGMLHIRSDNPKIFLDDIAGGAPIKCSIGSDTNTFVIYDETNSKYIWRYVPTSNTIVTDASLIVDTDNGASPFYVSRNGGYTETLEIWVTDTSVIFLSEQDENIAGYGNMIFRADDDGTADGYFAFQGKSGTERCRILATGNIGIGVTDPDAKVEIFGTSTQLKLSYDATNYCTVATGANGDTTITTVDADGAAGHINFVPDGNVGFGVASPTSYVHIKAGTATAGTAPIKLTDGVLLGTAETGTIEYAGNKFYITSVDCQQVIDRSGAAVTSTTTVSNTTDETTIYTHACPANSFRVGNHIHIECSGIISNDSASDDITINIYVGSDLISSYNPAIGNVTNANWHIILHTTIRTIGATGTIASHGHVEINGNEDIANELDTIDTTASNNITVTVQWDNAKAGNTISLYQGIPHISN